MLHYKLGGGSSPCRLHLKINVLCLLYLVSFIKEYTLWSNSYHALLLNLPEQNAITLPFSPLPYILLQINLLHFMQNCFELTKISMRSK